MFRLEDISGFAIVCTKCSNWNILELCSNWSILSIHGCAYPEIRMSWVKWNGVWGLGAAEVAWDEWRRRLALGGGECQLHRLAGKGQVVRTWTRRQMLAIECLQRRFQPGIEGSANLGKLGCKKGE
jgi:hypothetical protein